MGWCGMAAFIRDMLAETNGGGGTAVDSRAARSCPDLDNDVVRGGELIPSSLVDVTSAAKSKGLEPQNPCEIRTDNEGSGELTCTLLFPLPHLR
jgi:hypothetical protein